MFTGLSAFPLTPLSNDAVDEAAFIRLVERLGEAGVDSITALGSTGSYAYLSSDERSRVGAVVRDSRASGRRDLTGAITDAGAHAASGGYDR